MPGTLTLKKNKWELYEDKLFYLQTKTHTRAHTSAHAHTSLQRESHGCSFECHRIFIFSEVSRL